MKINKKLKYLKYANIVKISQQNNYQWPSGKALGLNVKWLWA